MCLTAPVHHNVRVISVLVTDAAFGVTFSDTVVRGTGADAAVCVTASCGAVWFTGFFHTGEPCLTNRNDTTAACLTCVVDNGIVRLIFFQVGVFGTN
jgi:hypothetical protein